MHREGLGKVRMVHHNIRPNIADKSMVVGREDKTQYPASSQGGYHYHATKMHRMYPHYHIFGGL